jgi:hypothetical protein
MNRPLLRTAAVLGALSLPVAIDANAVQRAADLWRLAAAPHPYVASSTALFICVWASIVAVSGCAFVLAPGLLAAQVLRVADNAGDWVLRGFTLSLVGVSVAVTALQVLVGHPVSRIAFQALIVVLCLVVMVAGQAKGRAAIPAPASAGDRSLISSLIVAPIVIAIVLAPKIFWESFNSDGAHAFEASRRLIYSVGPFFPVEAGGIASYPGFKTVLPSYPMSWFVRLFGEIEPAIRVPYLLVLVSISGGIASLSRRDRTPNSSDPWLVWLGLLVFTVVMAFSASYETYSADLALPGLADAMTIAMLLGMIAATVQRRPVWIAICGALLYTTTPAGALLTAFWLAASVVALRPLRWREAGTIAAVLVGCVIAERAMPALTNILGIPGPGAEHATGDLASRLLSVQWRDWHRFGYALIPAGIVPAIAVMAWWKQDDVSRAVSLVTAATFGFFYLQDRFALHYFSPVWILPLVVWWRMAPPPDAAARSRAMAFRALTAFAAVVAIALSTPPETRPWIVTREIGEAIEDRGPGYATGDPSAFARSELLGALFPTPAHAKVPLESYGGSHLSWSFYSHRRDASRPAAYVLQPESAPPPTGGVLVKASGAGALFLLDSAAFSRHRTTPAGAGGIARVYRVAKYTLFYH